MEVLNFKDKELKEAVSEFENLYEEHLESNESADYIVYTNSYEVQGALLELIDNLEIEHSIELGGKVIVTLG